METPPTNDSLASLSPPVGNASVFSEETCKQTKNAQTMYQTFYGYILPFITKPKLTRVPLIHSGYQAHQKETSSVLLYPVFSVKERYRKTGKYNISRVLQLPVSSPQASPKVEASGRPNQTQHLPTRRKVQN